LLNLCWVTSFSCLFFAIVFVMASQTVLTTAVVLDGDNDVNVFGRHEAAVATPGASSAAAGAPIELQPMLRNKSACPVADGGESGLIAGSDGVGSGSNSNNKRPQSQQEMEEPRCVTWFKVCLIGIGLAMLAAVLVIMTDVAYVWWQGGNQNGASGFLQPVVNVFFDRTLTNSTLTTGETHSDS